MLSVAYYCTIICSAAHNDKVSPPPQHIKTSVMEPVSKPPQKDDLRKLKAVSEATPTQSKAVNQSEQHKIRRNEVDYGKTGKVFRITVSFMNN